MLDIFINEQPLNFTLEGEQFFHQVRLEVTKWLTIENYVIESCKINNEEVILENLPEWDNKKIESIGSLRFGVRPLVELNFERLQTVYSYLMLLEKGIEKENAALFLDLSQEYSIIEEQLSLILNRKQEYTENSDVLLFTNLLETSGFFKGKIEHRDALQNCLSMCKTFMSAIQDRIHEITNPEDELKAAVRQLSSLIDPINEIPIQLQTGKDQEAMQVVLRFIESSQKMIRLYPILKATSEFDMQRKLASGETLEEFYSDFNSILNELQQAFNATDSILIGDLMEYEISPRIENLTTLIT